MPPVSLRPLGATGLVSPAASYGCMGLSWAYGAHDASDEAVAERAFDAYASAIGVLPLHLDTGRVRRARERRACSLRFLPLTRCALHTSLLPRSFLVGSQLDLLHVARGRAAQRGARGRGHPQVRARQRDRR